MTKIRRSLALAALPLTLLATACSTATATRDDTGRTVRELLDRDQISTLIDQLGVTLDEGRFEDLRTIYTAEATAHTPGGVATGIAAVIAQASRNHDPSKKIQHVLTNVLITLHGDTAEVRTNVVATFAPAGDGARLAPEPEYTLGGVYRFDAARTAQGWRLASVRMSPLWSTGIRP
ncbi:nuclear transport factor 2 family protein [Nocardia sp. NPDC051832]|uniref:nuclear transport factor 2 family protein n=1 Tax=Nocardia sp. NPDC051832 TaxID=3155673 RepID=UPI003437824E